MTYEFRPLQVERAVAIIRDKIRSREYPSGKRLLLEPLGKALQVSVIPIRDALAQLEEEGLVEGAPGRGWHVAKYDAARLQSLAELREALECQAARLCAVRATNDELEELALLARQADRMMGAETEAKFHLRLAAVARSDNILKVIERAHVLQLAFDPGGGDPVKGDTHAKVVRAIVRRDPEAADRVMRKHCASTAIALGLGADYGDTRRRRGRGEEARGSLRRGRPARHRGLSAGRAGQQRR